MKERRVCITQAASDDLEEAVHYLVHVARNPKAALALLDEFGSKMEALRTGAGVFPFVRDDVAAAAGYRWADVKGYVALFRIADEETVAVERLFHHRQNWMRLIR